MPLSGTLVAAGTAITNPAPNTIGVAPIIVSGGVWAINPAWTVLGFAALGPMNLSGPQVPVARYPIEFIPSVAGATYTVNLWNYNRIANTWVQPDPDATPTKTIVGADLTYIANPGDDLWFPQLSNISSGTVTIYFDNGLARAQ